MHSVGDPFESTGGVRPAMRVETVRTDSSKAAFLSVPVPVLVVAAGGTITLCNKAAATLLGVDADEVEGRQIEHVLVELEELERLTAGGARAVVACELPDGRRARIAARIGRYPQWSPRAARVLVLEDAGREVLQEDDAPFEVAEVLQMAALSRKSLVVDVLEGDQLFGRIVVVDGQPWWARDALDEGTSAFRRLAFRSCAHATCTRLRGQPPPRNLEAPLDLMLLDAARVRDEEMARAEIAAIAPRAAVCDDGAPFPPLAPLATTPPPPPTTTSSGGARRADGLPGDEDLASALVGSTRWLDESDFEPVS